MRGVIGCSKNREGGWEKASNERSWTEKKERKKHGSKRKMGRRAKRKEK